MDVLHRSIKIISEAMQFKLNKRSSRYPKTESGEDRWMVLPLNVLLDHLNREEENFKVLLFSITGRFESDNKIDPDILASLRNKAADYMNLIMMITDRVGALGRRSSEDDVYCFHYLISGFSKKDSKSGYICKICGQEDFSKSNIDWLKDMNRIDTIHKPKDFDKILNEENEVIGLILKRKGK
jgi:hypothetical protein